MMGRDVRLVILILLILSVFSGCNLQMTMLSQNTKPTSTKPSEPTDTTEATDPTQSTGETQPNQSKNLGQPAEDSVRPVTMPTELPNVQNGVYASCGNYYYTIYLNAPPEPANEKIVFSLMTEKPLPEDAKIVTGLKAEGDVSRISIIERTPKSMTMDDYEFAIWKGAEVDWSKMWSLEKTRYDAILDYRAGKISVEDVTTTSIQLAEYKEQTLYGFTGLADKAQDEWKAGNVFCHVYEVTIHLRKYVEDEELTSVELIAGDMSCTIPVGCIRLRKKVDPETKELNNRVTGQREISAQRPTDMKIPEYAAGTNVRQISFGVVALEDMSLTDVYFFANGGENCGILGVEVQITMTDGDSKLIGDSIQLTWTPGTPLQVRKNELVGWRVYYEDSWAQMKEYAAKNYMVLEYQCGGETGRILMDTLSPTRTMDWDQRYFWAFTDVDLTPYYEEYVWPKEQYTKEQGGRLPTISQSEMN